jgi:hypothetical protein
MRLLKTALLGLAAVQIASALIRLDDNDGDCGMFKDSCGSECFLPEFEFCCGDQIYPQSKEDPSSGGMPKPLYCCIDTAGKEYPSFSCDTTPTAVVPEPEMRLDNDCGMFRDECGNDCFLPEFEFCCGDQIYPQSKEDPESGGMPKPLYCCTTDSGKEYTAFSCDQTPTAVVPAPETRLDDEDCGDFRVECGDDCYLPGFEGCCGNQLVYDLTKEDPQSGGALKSQFCCKTTAGKYYSAFSCDQAPAVVIPAPEVRLDDAANCSVIEYPCGSDCYDAQMEFCCAGVVYLQDQPDASRGGAEYPMMCCQDATTGKEYAAYTCN